mmetsp:Transcript_7934/g.17593  ORF Transcript_7934/g.17593 Transcript_7934/m.17593 type:complete len:553 (-) Transcript_7934:22-1680(-)
MRYEVLWLLACLLCRTVESSDLQGDLYKMAKKSKHLSHLTPATFDSFMDSTDKSYVAVLFHIGTCHICKDALPTMELVAKHFAEKKGDIALGHVDCTNLDSKMKDKLNIGAYPCLRFFRRGEKGTDEAAWNAFSGKQVRVTSDEDLILAMSREAGMSMEAPKSAKRLEAAGKEVLVHRIAFDDLTFQAVLPKVGKVWLPLEAMEAEDLPEVRRHEKSFQYRPKSWKREAMQDFMQRMMRPPIATLSSARQLQQDLKGESQAALVLCAAEATPQATKVARAWQDQHLFFIAPEPSLCPVAQQDEKPLLVVYSPAHQQWSPSWTPKAAAVVADSSTVAQSYGKFAAWVSRNRFPGVWNVGYENFPELVGSPRKVVLAAVAPERVQENRRVLEALHEAARPQVGSDSAPDIYEADESSFQWGVVDGNLNGLDAFGILRTQLPRVVVLEGRDSWVEDADELQVFSLKDDLKKLDTMWRRRSGFKGYALVMARDALKLWKSIDKWAEGRGGHGVRMMVVAGFAMSLFLVVRVTSRVASALVSAVLASDGEEEKPKKS